MIYFLVKTKNNTLIVQIFYNLENRPTFHSEKRLVKIRECFVGLSILLVCSGNAGENISKPANCIV